MAKIEKPMKAMRMVNFKPITFTESEKDEFALKFAEWFCKYDGTMSPTKSDLEQFKQSLK